MRYKGSLAENYVLNELQAQGEQVFFWRSGKTAEIDILLESDGRIFPMEVKSADNTRAKSYRQFCKRYAPEVGYKISLKNIGEIKIEERRIEGLMSKKCSLNPDTAEEVYRRRFKWVPG